MYPRVVFQQADLDTCLAGLLLGVTMADPVSVARDGATEEELADPAVLCVEAGGSGDTARNKFDHHDRGGSWPPACVQAWQATGAAGTPELERLIAYVAEVDVGRGAVQLQHPDGRIGLSSLFSGLRLTVSNPTSQFFAGIALLRTVLHLKPAACRRVPGDKMHGHTWCPIRARELQCR